MSEAIDLNDQVPRKLRYELRHPGVVFYPPCVHEPKWRAVLDDGAETEVRALQLVTLMDKLEKIDRADGEK